MRIVIATGIYPPDPGGPARYAKNIAEALRGAQHSVSVVARLPMWLPYGVRHFAFFIRVFFALLRADAVIMLDTFSTAMPTLYAAKLLRKKILVRIGGDQVWESFNNRELVPLHEFYKKERVLTKKEQFIKRTFANLLKSATVIAFTTKWQKEITEDAYNFDTTRSVVVENHYDKKHKSIPPKEKRFMWNMRPAGFKNADIVREAFRQAQEKRPEIVLSEGVREYGQLMKTMESCYAVLNPSVSDIGPNFILEAVEHNKPFICTRHTGLYDRLKDVGVFVNPFNVAEIRDAILSLCDENEYKRAVSLVSQFNYTHSWDEIAEEYIALLEHHS